MALTYVAQDGTSVATTSNFSRVDCTAGSLTYQLPDITSARGETISYEKTDSGGNTLTVKPDTGSTINGSASSQVLTLQYQTMSFYAPLTGVDWLIRTTTISSDASTHAALTAAHGATGANVGTTNTQNLSNKTLVSPVVSTGLTASGSAANDFSASTGAFKTSTGTNTLGGTVSVAANKDVACAAGTTALDMSLGTGVFKSNTGANTMGGAVTVADATTPSVTTAAGKTNSGFVLVNGKTSGGLKLLPTDAMGNNLIVTPAAVASADRTLTLPDPGGADSVAYIALAQTLTNKNVVQTITTISGDGAITITGGVVALTKGSAAAITIAAPSAPQAGTTIKIFAGSAFAHVVTFTGATLDDGITGGGKTTVTMAAFVGSSIEVTAYNLRWTVVAKNAITSVV